MRLRVNRSDEGLPRIEIYFEEDGEPYMVLDAYGFDSDKEIVDTLKDVAESMSASSASSASSAFSPQPRLGEWASSDAQARYEMLMGLRKPGETVLDVERRIKDEFQLKQPKSRQFNPQPRGTVR